MDEAVESVRSLLRVAVPAMKPADPTVRAVARLAVDATAIIDPAWFAEARYPLKAQRHPEEFARFILERSHG